MVAWSAEEKLHVTVRFLGDQPAAIERLLVAGLREVAADVVQHDLTVGAFGVFPSPSRPRVLWVGVGLNVALAALYQEVDDLCDRLGLGRESRPYHPHVTLGRVRVGRRVDVDRLRATASALNPLQTSRVDSLDLMLSHPTAEGTRYTVVEAAPLRCSESR